MSLMSCVILKKKNTIQEVIAGEIINNFGNVISFDSIIESILKSVKISKE